MQIKEKIHTRSSSRKYVEWFLPISKQLKRILNDDGSFILNIKEHPSNGEEETYVLELVLEIRSKVGFGLKNIVGIRKTLFRGIGLTDLGIHGKDVCILQEDKRFKMYQDAVKVPIGEWADERF